MSAAESFGNTLPLCPVRVRGGERFDGSYR
jgi:hypothetical protein